MKITANRKEDLMRARDELARKKQARDEKHHREYDAYREAQLDVFSGIEYILNSNLSKFNLLSFDVKAEDRWSEAIRVQVRCNERRVHDDTSALSWNFDVTLKEDGEIVKESGSWSGLNATTSENLDSLKQTYDALVYLNGVDWNELLNVELPKYQDFVTFDNENLNPEGIDYDFEIFVEELKEHVNDGYAFAGKARDDGSRWSRNATGWYFITDVKPKTAKVKFLNSVALGNGSVKERIENMWEDNIRISTLYSLINKPLDINKFW